MTEHEVDGDLISSIAPQEEHNKQQAPAESRTEEHKHHR